MEVAANGSLNRPHMPPLRPPDLDIPEEWPFGVLQRARRPDCVPSTDGVEPVVMAESVDAAACRSDPRVADAVEKPSLRRPTPSTDDALVFPREVLLL